jgi:DNA-binding MurR/RpiR family transcriptional regulator
LQHIIIHNHKIPPMKEENILQKIKARKGEFSHQQIKIAAYLIDNYERVPFLTATQLGKEIGVSQPTVIRFAQFMGFPKFFMFLEAFQDQLQAQLTSKDRLSLSLEPMELLNNGDFGIILKDIRTLNQMVKTFPLDQFNLLVEKICKSNKVFIVGIRGSASLAQHLGYFLSKVKSNIFVVQNGSSIEYDKFIGAGESDLLIAIAFPRYPKETIDITQYCRKNRIYLSGITDKIDSPLAGLVDLPLVIPITFSTIFDSYCSVFCLFNMIVTKVGRTNSCESEFLSEEFEALARARNIFI